MVYHLIQFKEQALPGMSRLRDIQAPPPMKNPPGALGGAKAAPAGQAAANDQEMAKKDT